MCLCDKNEKKMKYTMESSSSSSSFSSHMLNCYGIRSVRGCHCCWFGNVGQFPYPKMYLSSVTTRHYHHYPLHNRIHFVYLEVLLFVLVFCLLLLMIRYKSSSFRSIIRSIVSNVLYNQSLDLLI